MKKIIYTVILLFIVLTKQSFAQTFEIKIVENSYGYLEVQMRETSGSGTPTTSTIINDISFEIRWLSSLNTDVAVICSSNSYNLADALGSKQTNGSYDYRVFQATSTPFNCPTNWMQNQWETLTTFKATSGSGTGTFEVAPDGWVAQGLNWNQGDPPVDYTPTVNGSVSYTYPTVVYDFVWTGAGSAGLFQDAHSLSLAGNWETQCGDAVGSAPTASNNCFIPSGLSNYPSNIYLAFITGQTFTVNHLRIESGGQINFGIQATAPETFVISGNLLDYGSFSINADAGVTSYGSSYIDAANGLIVSSDANGSGSFIDNGTITYGTNGTAKVQTYLSNSAGTGNFDIHFVGPTVDEENYTGGGTGAFLSAFDLANGSTYAYSWDESQLTVNGWQNISSNTYEVRTADGIGLSSTDNTNHTLEMTGALITGSVSSPALTFSNNHYELISNPYPSSIDFDNLATDNTAVVQNKYWIWDPATNSYVNRSNGSGGSQYIQVGQGFIVETKQAGTFDFTNSRRVHSNDAFRETVPFELTIVASGGMPGYKSEAIVRFTEDATNNYDIEYDGEFWQSQNSDATSVRSLTEDGVQASVNMFSLESLSAGSMFSVPVKFDCGYTTQYTLDFSGFESFEYGTEVYLEDILTADEWVYLNDNPVYTFDAAENQGPDRFILHFFGPTGIDENKVDDIQIYSYERNAFVKNNGNEKIKIVYVFNMASELMMKLRLPENQKLNRFFVSDQRGYYIIKVITNENVYTEKVLIY